MFCILLLGMRMRLSTFCLTAWRQCCDVGIVYGMHRLSEPAATLQLLDIRPSSWSWDSRGNERDDWLVEYLLAPSVVYPQGMSGRINGTRGRQSLRPTRSIRLDSSMWSCLYHPLGRNRRTPSLWREANWGPWRVTSRDIGLRYQLY